MRFPRTSGILLHPTSLPGAYGIGDFGDSAFRWVDFLAETGQTLWQLMPLGYTGYGDSPYQSFSAFAGDPLLISPDLLHKQDLLTINEIDAAPKFPDSKVDYGPVIKWKMQLLKTASNRFFILCGESNSAYQAFLKNNKQWLDDFALFMALKEAHNGDPWYKWEDDIRNRMPEALTAWQEKVAEGIAHHKFLQYQFYTQWHAVKKYANEKNIKIIGDVPIFVAYDSDDVWANPNLFDLDKNGKPLHVAGVPPDYFSATGQLWGNPLYRWDEIASQGYTWWIRRFKAALEAYDIIRIDHFRGFEAYWAVPGDETTAINGQWIKGPGLDLFLAVKAALGDLPIIAEDLGLLTADVIALRDEMEFPGMKILEFAFNGNPLQEYLPHNYIPNCVVYSGTHDNDTVKGWYNMASAKEKAFFKQYTGSSGHEVNWDFIRLAFGSIADMAIVPLQDIIGLGSEARMNTPGTAAGNWSWRFTKNELTPEIRKHLKDITFAYGRGHIPTPEEITEAKKQRAHPQLHSTHPRIPNPHL